MRTQGHVRTSDDVQLNFTDTGGNATPLVMLHGWGQTSAMFGHQLEALSTQHRVITYDMRGHGESAKPGHGYRIARLAADLRDILRALDLEEIDLLGWSMGASVAWSYLELFGSESVRKLVFVDQPAAVIAVPWMSEGEQQAAGSILSVEGLVALADRIHQDESGAVVRAFVRSMFSDHVPDHLWEFVNEQIARTPTHAAVPLLFDHGTQDWRDVFPRIDVPTLVIGVEGSHIAADSQRYVASQIPDARVHIFERDVASSHFPFLQNPVAFNEVISDFLGDVSTSVPTTADRLSESSDARRAYAQTYRTQHRRGRQ